VRRTFVSLEIYGHLRSQTNQPEKLYRNEINQLIRSVGLTLPALSVETDTCRRVRSGGC